MPIESPRIIGPMKLPSSCWIIRIRIRKINACHGSRKSKITAPGIAPMNGPNTGMMFVMPTMMLMSVAYDKPRMFMLTNVSTPIIAESRIFPAKKPPKLRFASWQIRRVVSAALFGRNARVSTRAWRSSLSFCRRR